MWTVRWSSPTNLCNREHPFTVDFFHRHSMNSNSLNVFVETIPTVKSSSFDLFIQMTNRAIFSDLSAKVQREYGQSHVIS